MAPVKAVLLGHQRVAWVAPGKAWWGSWDAFLTSESLSGIPLTDGGCTVCGHQHGSYNDGSRALVADETCHEGHQ